MKQEIIKYIITDSDNKLFWTHTSFYQRLDNKILYAVWFSNQLTGANFMDKNQADILLESFVNNPEKYIHATTKESVLDFKTLIAVPVTITYETNS